ncbi:MAG: single-stranded-DNA-specific exonuclease [Thalassolituus oleivorans]
MGVERGGTQRVSAEDEVLLAPQPRQLLWKWAPAILYQMTRFMGDFDWVLRPVLSAGPVDELAQKLNGLPPGLARALYLRGVETFEEARSFFRASLDALLQPEDMKDMAVATARVVAAIQARERVVVYGDYDVDGTTSTAMLTHFLRDHGVPSAYFIPDRFKHGYGLCVTGIDEVIELGATLMIAIDCGVTSLKEVAHANERGLDVVICDHHTPLDDLPQAVAVLDPKRVDCSYAFKDLCACGVGFKLLKSVASALGEDPASVDQYLDLVAIATAADVVPLTGENRILLREGIKQIRTRPRLGIQKLAEEAGTELTDCDTRSIQFGLAPRINAAGRLGDAKRAVKLMLAEDEAGASELAKRLERVNADRRALDQSVLATAEARASVLLADGGRSSIVLYDPDWHLGVVGIVAARLVERFNLPTVLLGQVNGLAKGSARSIAGVNIYDALAACSDLFETFGGHDYAAGLSIKPEKMEEFVRRFDEAIAESSSASAFRRRLDVDAELTLGDIDTRFWAVLEQFGPFGAENRPPVFVSRGLSVAGHPTLVGKSGDHLKLRVSENGSAALNGIGFGLGPKFDLVADSVTSGSTIDLAYSITENNWKGVRSLQLQLLDIKPT